MTAPSTDLEVAPTGEQVLIARIKKLERINAALMAHVERATDHHDNGYSLFQTAIMLDGRVRSRTAELTALMHSLERSNEALKAAKEDAEQANRSKTKFLAAASHDLLQPLNAARLSSSALAGMVISDEARVLASQIERGLQTIEDLIKTLLDISKLDAGIVVPIKKPLRLAKVMTEIEQSFRGVAEQRALRLVIRCPDLVVESDIVLLHRVLQNLVSNALRYTSVGGVVVAARKRGDHCQIAVIDSGQGIPEEERELIFQEFYRGRGSACETNGLGLGLSIVRRMIVALGHDLTFRSRVGRGTAFCLTLPLSHCPSDDSDPRAVAEEILTNAHVIVIENDAATRTALERLLQSWGLRVSAYASLANWSRASRQAADLIIADFHLDAGAIGPDAIAAIRTEAGVALPAIVTTADHSEAIEVLVRQAGAELMRKPIKPAQLRSLLSFLIQSSAKLQKTGRKTGSPVPL
jgi:signal transduction histidine kinase/CheY-like chemotaxis protein